RCPSKLTSWQLHSIMLPSAFFWPASPSTLGSLNYSIEPLDDVILRHLIIPLGASAMEVSK
ncbi:hypothetical protein A2U01_0103240, partial [Trifolium medium]|nr:hypothetical protein [Trifolium medium]